LTDPRNAVRDHIDGLLEEDLEAELKREADQQQPPEGRRAI
jgi:hypothetical protein